MTQLINPKYASQIYTALAATGTAAIGLCIGRPESVKIAALTVLTGVSYGITNDMIACRDCIEYFTVGHVYDGLHLRRRPLLTLNPTLNALVWGMLATWHVSTIAGCALATVARVPVPKLSSTNWQILRNSVLGKFINFNPTPAEEKMADKPDKRRFETLPKITARQLAPYLIGGATLLLLVAHIRSRLAEAAMLASPINKYWGVPLDLQAGWEVCNIRNMTGYAGLAIGGMMLITAMVAARTGLITRST